MVHAACMVAALYRLASPASAQECRLALVLALDVSASMDSEDDRLQRQGLAGALLAPEVVQAFLAGDPVALYVFQWSGAGSQTPVLPDWALVHDAEDLSRIAAAIAASPRIAGQEPTALGSALVHATRALARAPACRARTVDVSGDGESNEGPEPKAV